MIEQLGFEGVGPAPRLTLDFRRRINFLTGDNGLGKSFLLDAAWWALTRTWARTMLRPHRPPGPATIRYRYGARKGPHETESQFDRSAEWWKLSPGRPPIPGLVLYAQVDGGFSVWDPARNYWKGQDQNRPPAYLFSSEEVWDGLPGVAPSKLCNGLIADWANWQLENGEAMRHLGQVLVALSPSSAEPLEPGELVKLSLADARKHPTLRAPYGLEVPLVHASAGIRRIVALAYLLVWAWQEHRASADLRGDEPAREIIFLVDEIEAHLHPEWQRRIVPALLRVMEALTGEAGIPAQLVAATHSPLILASVEAQFDENEDAVWELKLEDGRVALLEYPWSRRGDANAWLTSSVFDLKEPRSVEGEKAISDALALFAKAEAAPSQDMDRVEAALRAALSDTDRFWPRWTQYRHANGR